jgi:hypothetical protein
MENPVIVKPPQHYNPDRPSVFLAGSIEQGKAEDWQVKVAQEIDSDQVIVYNPRRDRWTELDQKQLDDQIMWEQRYLFKSSFGFFYFAPDTTSVVSMLELGQVLESTRYSGEASYQFIAVHPKYFRRENIKFTCGKYGVAVFDSVDMATYFLKRRLYEQT